MVAGLAAFEDEESEDDEDGSQCFAVFDVDHLLQILAHEQLAYEHQSDV